MTFNATFFGYGAGVVLFFWLVGMMIKQAIKIVSKIGTLGLILLVVMLTHASGVYAAPATEETLLAVQGMLAGTNYSEPFSFLAGVISAGAFALAASGVY
jgi:uncharacterized membrane protein